jgi:riboflavin kinase/FMN adenylyltransferase
MQKYLTPTAVAIGNFDGLHRGHKRVIQPILDFARPLVNDWQMPSCSLSATKDKSLLIQNSEQAYIHKSYETQNCYPTVVTFNPHPQEFFTGQRRASLTPLNEKVQQLLSLGVKQVVSLIFNRELASLSPQQFVEKILVQQLQAQKISVGHDFRFGEQRRGTATDLQAIAATFGIPVTIVSPYTHQSERISSSSIRQALEQGEMQRAKALLGRFYTLTGFAVKGQQLSKTIDFPTAKLQLLPEKLLPRHGVYAVRVFIEDEREQGWERGIMKDFACKCPFPLAYKGIMNIHRCPEVNDIQPSVEVYLLDWSGDLSGKILTVQPEYFLRPEQEFASTEDLRTQIYVDLSKARSVLAGEQNLVVLQK